VIGETQAPNLLAGWGRRQRSRPGELIGRAAMGSELRDLTGRGLIARGLARSYGDAAQRAGGTVVDGLTFDAEIALDVHSGLIGAGAGTSMERLLEVGIPQGWFVPVTPGTRQITLGGALAADVHGKNHHVDGSIAQHITRFRLLTPQFGEIEVSRASDPALFWATAGGLGLTGVITWVELQMKPTQSAMVLVDTERSSNLDDLMARMEHRDEDFRYSVAWIDLAAKGASMGRGVLTRGNLAPRDALPTNKRLLQYSAKSRLASPPIPINLVGRQVVQAFNQLWFHKTRPSVDQPTSINSFFYPLDGIANWNRLYGPKGFLQYQTVIPFGQEGLLTEMVHQLSSVGAASFLAVLKRFGAGNEGHLSFPMAGWTLALDLADQGPVLDELLLGFDRSVAECGGRTYLAKDSRMDPSLMATMYPRLDEWREVIARVDPNEMLRSDLSVRLGLSPNYARHRRGNSAVGHQPQLEMSS
jgi:decaprenylphospho-beta-D-ribofuranose 2-oxidase